MQQVVQHEWGVGLIGSWNSAGWMDLAPRIGDKIARLIGAGARRMVAADSTSVNLFKVLSAALSIARADAPQRTRIVSERSNFPTDLYIAEALAPSAASNWCWPTAPRPAGAARRRAARC